MRRAAAREQWVVLWGMGICSYYAWHSLVPFYLSWHPRYRPIQFPFLFICCFYDTEHLHFLFSPSHPVPRAPKTKLFWVYLSLITIQATCWFTPGLLHWSWFRIFGNHVANTWFGIMGVQATVIPEMHPQTQLCKLSLVTYWYTDRSFWIVWIFYLKEWLLICELSSLHLPQM